jgi:hypothetical protein
MAVLDFVQVPPDDPTGKKIHNVRQNVGGDDRYQQLTGVCDPDDPTAIQKVTAAKALATDQGAIVRPVPANYDSGLQAVPGTLTVLTGTTIEVQVALFHNQSGQGQSITLTDGAGAYYLNARPLQPKELLVLVLHGVKFQGGVKWQCSGSVNGQIRGDQ